MLAHTDYIFIVQILTFVASIVSFLTLQLRSLSKKSSEKPHVSCLLFLLLLQNIAVLNDVIEDPTSSRNAAYTLFVVILSIILIVFWHSRVEDMLSRRLSREEQNIKSI